MRKQQCDNPRYDTTIEIKPLNGPRPPPTQLCGNPKMSDGTIGRFGTMTLGRAGSLPGSFGGRPTENRTRSYYRSNWDSDESIDPTIELTCLQLEDTKKRMDAAKSKHKTRSHLGPTARRRWKIACTILTWVVLLSLTAFTAWLYLRVENLRTEKGQLQTKVVDDAKTMVNLQIRTNRLSDQKDELAKRVTDGICEIEKLQNATKLLKTQLDSVSSQLNVQDDRLRMVQDRLSFIGGCYDCVVRDCSDVRSRNVLSGIYPIWPKNFTNALYVYCDHGPSGGGWTVLQRRLDGSVNFYRNWTEYKKGFGDLGGEFWLGMDSIYLLLSQNTYRMRVDMEDWEGNKAYAEYSSIQVDTERNNYRIRLGTYSGNAGDSIAGTNATMDYFTRNLNNMQFSTRDRDNDGSSRNCALLFKGGWWYNDCYNANLNGIYYRGGNYTDAVQDGIEWSTWKGWRYSLKGVSMKIRPVNFVP
ncbi:angiopoietin-related protein 7-like [Branchiostoma floridae]|uniref:Angiopoietin-related protein 7-like n=1 Tax=Branchiostoma floridae TaxID=7739 RepID=A0A9J7LZL0_BRAFL|nr:angiopoietin-related protein 7-like [Branchiostoma floridae]XP_035691663.1 angiopoietin-related protein 7-like [Branchiostoma floridae]